MDDSMGPGNVLDRSQISTSFLILGYKKNVCQYEAYNVMARLVREMHSACMHRKPGKSIPSDHQVPY